MQHDRKFVSLDWAINRGTVRREEGSTALQRGPTSPRGSQRAGAARRRGKSSRATDHQYHNSSVISSSSGWV